MNEKAHIRPLCAALRSQINKAAHQAGLKHETQLKAAMTARLMAARAAGASFATLAAMLITTMADTQ